MSQSVITGIAAHIAVIDGTPTTTTQDIAEVYGKAHDKVLRIVRQRMAEAGEWGVANFSDTPYTNPQNGQTYPVIRMTKKGFHFVVGKFTGAKAVQHQIAFADEFERMETELAKPAAAPKALPAPESLADLALSRLRAGLFVMYFDENGDMCLFSRSRKCVIAEPDDLAGMIADPKSKIGRELLPDIITAAAGRLKP